MTTQVLIKNGCRSSGLGYAEKSNTDKDKKVEPENNKPITSDKVIRKDRSRLTSVKFDLNNDWLKSVNEKGSTSGVKSNFNIDNSKEVNVKTVNIGLIS